MWKPFLFSFTALLLSCANGRADRTDIDNLSKWRDDAQNANGLLSTRLAAIYHLGQIRSRDPETLMLLKGIFKDLLTDPKGDKFKHNLLFFHVAIALGNLGGDARELLPDLTAKIGLDRILDSAIEGATVKILYTPIPPICLPSVPMFPVLPPPQAAIPHPQPPPGSPKSEPSPPPADKPKK